jgi:hypothetical protein
VTSKITISRMPVAQATITNITGVTKVVLLDFPVIPA